MHQIHMKDFFISYKGENQDWAEWIAWQLEEEGYTTILQAWDFHAGGNFVLLMQKAFEKAERTISLLSTSYLAGIYTNAEWAAAFTMDPTGEKGALIPIRIEKCELKGLHNPIIYIDLFGLNKLTAKNTLLQQIKRTVRKERLKPEQEPDYPSSTERSVNREPRYPDAIPLVCNLPRRNTNFTGRENTIETLHNSLESGNNIALTQQALYGLGGIGKTQLAIEYAWRHNTSYDIVWLLRSEEPATLASDYAALATELNLLEKEFQEQDVVIHAVKKWLDHNSGWLLIFDNAKDTISIRNYLPTTTGGHVLITSRYQNWDHIGKPLQIEVWTREESVDFLQKRTGQSDEKAADELAKALGDLPLALEQAAAYINTRKKRYNDYLSLFNSRRKELWEREEPPDGYPYTIATTWSLAFDEIKSVPKVIQMLHLCSIVSPDTIPKTLLEAALVFYEKGAIINNLDVDDAVAVLCSYSLITVDTEKVSVHRLVQAVVRDRMSKDDLERYRDAIIQALSDRFPVKGYNHPSCWPECASLLPHAQAILEDPLLDKDESWQARAMILNNIGEYYCGRATYDDAELFFHRALDIREDKLGTEHLDFAYSLNNLAVLLDFKGKVNEAEPLYRRALAIRKKQLGMEHPDVALSLNNLAVLLYKKNKLSEAEPLFRQALSISEKQLGSEHPDVARFLNNLSALLREKGELPEAELLLQRALAIREKKFGPEHPDVAQSLNHLAALLQEKNKFNEAEPLFRRALAIRETQLGPEHPDLAESLNDLAVFLQDKGELVEAELLLLRALAIREKKLGPEHTYLAQTLHQLALLLYKKRKLQEAEPLFRRALAISEKKLSPEHPHLAQNLYNLAELLNKQGKFLEAKLLFRRALRILEKTFGEHHQFTISARNKCGYQKKKKR